MFTAEERGGLRIWKLMVRDFFNLRSAYLNIDGVQSAGSRANIGLIRILVVVFHFNVLDFFDLMALQTGCHDGS